MTGPDDPKRLVADGYDRIAERHAEWAAGVRTAERARYTARIIGALPRSAAVLDLGCGTGGPTTRSLAKHFRLTGVDISARSIKLARRNVPAAEFLVADMTEVQFPSQSFDAVVAFYSIIHVPREEQAPLFSHIAHWLRPGGLFLGTLTSGGEATDYEPDWLGVSMFWSGFDPATARSLIEAAGLRINSATIDTADEFGDPISFLWVEAQRPTNGTGERRPAAV